MQAEYSKNASAMLQSNVPSCRSLSSNMEGPSGQSSLSTGVLARSLEDSVKHRILYLSEQLRVEKTSRDQNTMGYLKLVSKADRHQALHIRQAFEKVNQRTSAAIAQTERRLRQCHQQLQELEAGHRLKEPELQECEALRRGKSQSLAASCHEDAKNCLLGSVQGKLPEARHRAYKRNLILHQTREELRDVKKLHSSLQAACQYLKEQYLMDLQASLESLQEERSRRTMMEQQVDDHLQGHLDEIYHVKHTLAATEEKMAYLSYERAKEIWEFLEIFKSRISRLETLEKVTQLELAGNLRRRPKEFLFRFMSLILTLTSILLVLVSSICACPLSLVNSRLRTCTIIILFGMGALVWQKRHTIPTTDWQAWIPSRWRLDSKDSKSP
ncbi:testis-specific protein TEX28 [Ochotona princeps]|uniref:testis-specific protein TEX28 n=1 Tax=Ochotona princeps TaxID=9978 RepID=UPI002714F4C8|nr:testis-specific protein TEX28 [Ochotona princeps]